MGESRLVYKLKAVALGGAAVLGALALSAFFYAERLKEKPSDNLSKHLDSIGLVHAAISFDTVADSTYSELADRLLDDSYRFIRAYREKILESASLLNVPPEMIGAIIINENYPAKRSAYHDFREEVGTLFQSNVSLGPGQVKISTAKMLDRYHGREELEYDEYLKILQMPDKNIGYIAEYIDFLRKRTRPAPDEKAPTEMTADELLHSSEYTLRIISGYVSGAVPRNSINLYGWAASDQIADLSLIFRGDSSLYKTLEEIYSKDNLKIREEISSMFEKEKHTWDAPIKFP